MITKIEYQFDYLPTYALEQILRADLLNMDEPFLSDDAIMHICRILSDRRHKEHPEIRSDVKRKLKEFLKYYEGEQD